MNKDIVIVVSEDDRGHFILAKYFLEHKGISNEIVWHKNGEETIDFFMDRKKSVKELGKKFLLLLDINMPRMDGIETLTIMKNDEELKKIPVIMLTTSVNPDNIKQCEKLGCLAYLSKPLDDTIMPLLEKL